MPIDYRKYHPEWQMIRSDILKRADNRCEICKVPNHEHVIRGIRDGIEVYQDMSGIIWRTADGAKLGEDYFGEFYDYRMIKVVLTISHQDHDINNNDYGNLKALCQLHHLRHDREDNARRRKSKSKTKQLSFFFK